MHHQGENEDKVRTAFTAIASMGRLQAYQCVTGQRQLWLLRLEILKPEDFNRPGHVFPLKYREGGVLKRAGHTEASVNLAVLAGLEPVAVLFARLWMMMAPWQDYLSSAKFAQRENLKIVSTANLMRVTLDMVKMSL